MQNGPRLDETPLFKRLDPEERAELEELLEPAYFDAGEAIFEEDGPEEWLYVLTTGTVEVHKQVLPGRAQLLAEMSAPTVVGEMGLLTEPKAAASVVARTSVEAHGIKREDFLSMLDENSMAACKVVHEIGKTLAERMAKTDESISGILSRLETRDLDLDVFQDSLMREWGF
ncbi:MAG: cyclic nucleotide-binding domain-containing protein [Rubrobacteraceae bacterium]